MSKTNFDIFAGDEKPFELSTAIGWLIGYDLDSKLPDMVKNGVINKEEAREIRGWSDNYTLAVNVTGSVMDYHLDSIEAVCFLDSEVGECMGIKHVKHTNAGEPWGVIVPSQSFKNSVANSAAPRG